jgi:peptidoglycan/xylan/chitin deacetylase (PgdA/CDA1 family)
MRRLKLTALVASLLSLVACRGACGPGVPILMFHSVGDVEDPYAVVDPKDFAAQLDWLKQSGYHTISLAELLDHQDHNAALPPKPIVLTFDDGAEDNYKTVFPLLRARGMKGTFFVVSRFPAEDEAHRRVENKGTPTERRFALWPELREMAAAGMEIGSHSLEHRRLTELDEEQVRRDARQSRAELEEKLGRPVQFFAYPYNSHRMRLRSLIEGAGYRAAVTGGRGPGDRYEMNRIGVYRGMKPADLQAAMKERGF